MEKVSIGGYFAKTPIFERKKLLPPVQVVCFGANLGLTRVQFNL